MPLSAFYALELLQYALGKCVHANSTDRRPAHGDAGHLLHQSRQGVHRCGVP